MSTYRIMYQSFPGGCYETVMDLERPYLTRADYRNVMDELFFLAGTCGGHKVTATVYRDGKPVFDLRADVKESYYGTEWYANIYVAGQFVRQITLGD